MQTDVRPIDTSATQTDPASIVEMEVQTDAPAATAEAGTQTRVTKRQPEAPPLDRGVRYRLLPNQAMLPLFVVSLPVAAPLCGCQE